MNFKFSEKRKNISEHLFETIKIREDNIKELFEKSVSYRSGADKYWRKMRAYYDGTHDTARRTGDFLTFVNIPWKPAELPDGYMHVESQVSPKLPDFEFSGRNSGDTDYARAREKITRYIFDINDMERKNATNERRLGIYGSAVWKLSAYEDVYGCPEIMVENPSPENIFPDPCASNIDECEYIGHVNRMSILRAERIFAEDMKRKGITFRELLRDEKGKSLSGEEDTVEVLEWWFRQRSDGEYINANGERAYYSRGDIALSVLICGKEVRYIPKFFTKTNYNSFPFAIYSRIPKDGSIWGKSELEEIIPLIDAADRQLAFAQLNTAFSANDIVVYEENAFSPDSYPDNRPGAVWKLRPGMMDKVSRLGGLAGESLSHYEIVEKYRTMIKDVLGNYDYMQGDYSTRVTTATGLALLSDLAANRASVKNVCKKAGFASLCRLCDIFALEFYTDEKISLIFDGDEKAAEYLSKIRSAEYIPEIDVRVNIGEGVENSRSFTISALTSLIDKDVNEENYPLVRAYINAVDIPEKAEIISQLDKKFGACAVL